MAAREEYEPWDLVNATPLLTERARDESKQQWDTRMETGLRNLPRGVVDVEYFRDVRPILDRSCVACHTKTKDEPAGNLVLDADDEEIPYRHFGKFPGTYFRLALDEKAQFGHKPPAYDSWGYPQASRTIRKFQSRRSLLVWKIYGKRLDGFSNDDHPSPSEPGARTLARMGEPVDTEKHRAKYDLDFRGKEMPPAKAVEKGTVEPLTDADRRTIVRWIDLGCPIDLDYDPQQPERRGYGYGWAADDNRPVLTVAAPAEDARQLTKIVIGMHDYLSGLDEGSLRVVASIPLGGLPTGANLARNFRKKEQGVWEWKLEKDRSIPPSGMRLDVSVRDQAGNRARIVRLISSGRKGFAAR